MPRNLLVRPPDRHACATEQAAARWTRQRISAIAKSLAITGVSFFSPVAGNSRATEERLERVLSGVMFWNGVGLGLGAAVPVGPVNVEIARRTLVGGPLAGFALGCGAVTIDVLFAVVVALGVASLTDSPWVKWPLTVIGIGVLFYLGLLSLRSAWRAWSDDRSAGPRGFDVVTADVTPQNQADGPPAPLPTPLGGYLAGLAMTGLNPYTWAFWLGGVSGSAKTFTEHPEQDLPIICLGVFAATLAWVICFTATMTVLKRFGGRRWLVVADAAGGLMLVGFAAKAAWQAASTL